MKRKGVQTDTLRAKGHNAWSFVASSDCLPLAMPDHQSAGGLSKHTYPFHACQDDVMLGHKLVLLALRAATLSAKPFNRDNTFGTMLSA